MFTSRTTKDKQANISRIPLPISLRPSKSILAKSKYYKKIQFFKLKTQSFIQATKSNIKNILKIKDVFLRLSSNKIIKIHNVADNNG